ncbi:hypothetical protein AYI68_g2263 [Smittium mucronatum]|uniref:Uncharacterized protein n=1 Tax=Smittium mucronatum TaxID=133383 RepID=A0A1R0H339_9FUNG|nr:hypothetical protein AYI68_g2263 [Smittium mucronatum]
MNHSDNVPHSNIIANEDLVSNISELVSQVLSDELHILTKDLIFQAPTSYYKDFDFISSYRKIKSSAKNKDLELDNLAFQTFLSFKIEQIIKHLLNIDKITGRLDNSIIWLDSMVVSLSALSAETDFKFNITHYSSALNQISSKANFCKNMLLLYIDPYFKDPKVFSSIQYNALSSQKSPSVEALSLPEYFSDMDFDKILLSFLPKIDSISSSSFNNLPNSQDFSIYLLENVFDFVNRYLMEINFSLMPLNIEKKSSSLNFLMNAQNIWFTWLSQIIELYPKESLLCFENSSDPLLFWSKFDSFSPLNFAALEKNQFIIPGICLFISFYSTRVHGISLSQLNSFKSLTHSESIDSDSINKTSLSVFYKIFSEKSKKSLSDSVFLVEALNSLDESFLESNLLNLIVVHLRQFEVLNTFGVNPSNFFWFLENKNKEKNASNVLAKIVNEKCKNAVRYFSDSNLSHSDKMSFWMAFYRSLLVLWDDGFGCLGCMDLNALKSKFFKTILLSNDLETAKSILDFDLYQKTSAKGDFEMDKNTLISTIVESAQEIANNSDTGNIESHELQKSVKILEMAKSFPQVQKELSFLEGVHLLWTTSIADFDGLNLFSDLKSSSSHNSNSFKLYQNSEFLDDIVPIQARTAKSIPFLINQVLNSNPKAYKKPKIIREAARLLGYYGDLIKVDNDSNFPDQIESDDHGSGMKSIDIGSSLAKVGKKLLNSSQWHGLSYSKISGVATNKIDTLEEAYIVSLLLDSASKSDDIDSAYQFMRQLKKVTKLKPSNSELIEKIWKIISNFSAKNFDQDDIRLEVLTFSIQICPLDKIDESLIIWREAVGSQNYFKLDPNTHSSNPLKVANGSDWWYCLESSEFQLTLDPEALMTGVSSSKIDSKISSNLFSRNIPSALTDNNLNMESDVASINAATSRAIPRFTKEHMHTSDKAIINNALSGLGSFITSGNEFDYKIDLLFEWISNRFDINNDFGTLRKLSDVQNFVFDQYICKSQQISLRTIEFIETQLSEVVCNYSLYSVPNFDQTQRDDHTKFQSGAILVKDLFLLLEKLYIFSSLDLKNIQIGIRLQLISILSSIQPPYFEPSEYNSNFDASRATFYRFIEDLFFFRTNVDVTKVGQFFWTGLITDNNQHSFLKIARLSCEDFSKLFDWEISFSIEIPPKKVTTQSEIYYQIIYPYLHERVLYLNRDGENIDLVMFLFEFLKEIDDDIDSAFVSETVLVTGELSKFLTLNQRIQVLQLCLGSSSSFPESSNSCLFQKTNRYMYLQLVWLLILTEISDLREPFEFSSLDMDRYTKFADPSNYTQTGLTNSDFDPYSGHPMWMSSISENISEMIFRILLNRDHFYFVLSVYSLVFNFINKFQISGNNLNLNNTIKRFYESLLLEDDSDLFNIRIEKILRDLSDISSNSIGFNNSSDIFETDAVSHSFKEASNSSSMIINNFILNSIEMTNDGLRLERKIFISEQMNFKYWRFLEFCNKNNGDALDSFYMQSIRVLVEANPPSFKYRISEEDIPQFYLKFIESSFQDQMQKPSGKIKLDLDILMTSIKILFIIMKVSPNTVEDILISKMKCFSGSQSCILFFISSLAQFRYFELSMGLTLLAAEKLNLISNIENPSSYFSHEDLLNSTFLELSLYNINPTYFDSQYEINDKVNSLGIRLFIYIMLGMNCNYELKSKDKANTKKYQKVVNRDLVKRILESFLNKEFEIKDLFENKFFAIAIGFELVYNADKDSLLDIVFSLLGPNVEKFSDGLFRSIYKFYIELVKDQGYSPNTNMSQFYYDVLAGIPIEFESLNSSRDRVLEEYYVSFKTPDSLSFDESIGCKFSNFVITGVKHGFDEDEAASFVKIWNSCKSVSEDNKRGFEYFESSFNTLSELCSEYGMCDIFTDIYQKSKTQDSANPQSTWENKISMKMDEDVTLDAHNLEALGEEDGWGIDLDLDIVNEDSKAGSLYEPRSILNTNSNLEIKDSVLDAGSQDNGDESININSSINDSIKSISAKPAKNKVALGKDSYFDENINRNAKSHNIIPKESEHNPTSLTSPCEKNKKTFSPDVLLPHLPNDDHNTSKVPGINTGAVREMKSVRDRVDTNIPTVDGWSDITNTLDSENSKPQPSKSFQFIEDSGDTEELDDIDGWGDLDVVIETIPPPMTGSGIKKVENPNTVINNVNIALDPQLEAEVDLNDGWGDLGEDLDLNLNLDN